MPLNRRQDGKVNRASRSKNNSKSATLADLDIVSSFNGSTPLRRSTRASVTGFLSELSPSPDSSLHQSANNKNMPDSATNERVSDLEDITPPPRKRNAIDKPRTNSRGRPRRMTNDLLPAKSRDPHAFNIFNQTLLPNDSFNGGRLLRKKSMGISSQGNDEAVPNNDTLQAVTDTNKTIPVSEKNHHDQDSSISTPSLVTWSKPSGRFILNVALTPSNASLIESRATSAPAIDNPEPQASGLDAPYYGVLSGRDADTYETYPTCLTETAFEKAALVADARNRERQRSMSVAFRGSDSFKPLDSGTTNGFPPPPEMIDPVNMDKMSLASKIRAVHFGNYEIKTWYAAPYPEEYSQSHILYICEFCLKYMNSEFVFWRHKLKCPMKHPPGDEIFRQGDISIFEVDGRKETLYCRNLCLLAKLFLGSKTLYYDVEPFMFYVMSEYTRSGCHFVGYFSKEKHNSSGYNLSCILTLPIYQRRGFGNFLIQFSYLLTRREKVTGTPEKPLSDLGLLSYRSYWRTTVCYSLRKRKPDQSISLEDISSETGMSEDDVISALEGLKAIVKDPIKKKYALRIDWNLVDGFIAKWEAKGYLQVDERYLVWTPVVLGKSGGVNSLYNTSGGIPLNDIDLPPGFLERFTTGESHLEPETEADNGDAEQSVVQSKLQNGNGEHSSTQENVTDVVKVYNDYVEILDEDGQILRVAFSDFHYVYPEISLEQYAYLVSKAKYASYEHISTLQRQHSDSPDGSPSSSNNSSFVTPKRPRGRPVGSFKKGIAQLISLKKSSTESTPPATRSTSLTGRDRGESPYNNDKFNLGANKINYFNLTPRRRTRSVSRDS